MFKDYDQKVSQNDLYALIREGEHSEQDFKYRISDARKIARTLSAFANTTGGRLLVGVRDNGSIAGVKDEDDIYMLESASEVFLKPALKLEVWAHEIEGKYVWEIEITEGKEKPYQVDEIDGLKAYYRDNDQNFVANAVLKEVWKQDRLKESKHPVAFTEKEQRLIQYLKDYEEVSVSKAAKVMQLHRSKTIEILARLIRWEVINWSNETQEGFRYSL
ncbi:MAG: ATP-binding protein [Schleiferiaceae bacterium]|nr:ATP-binding protein [Schleiferiaceae bacterium]MDG1903914.1 ATP-binding protein [Schleiferiaceae bacterium]